MRLAIFIVLLALTTSVSAAGGMVMGFATEPRSISSASGPGGYSDPKLIVHYPLQSGLMLYKITAFKYGW